MGAVLAGLWLNMFPKCVYPSPRPASAPAEPPPRTTPRATPSEPQDSPRAPFPVYQPPDPAGPLRALGGVTSHPSLVGSSSHCLAPVPPDSPNALLPGPARPRPAPPGPRPWKGRPAGTPGHAHLREAALALIRVRRKPRRVIHRHSRLPNGNNKVYLVEATSAGSWEGRGRGGAARPRPPEAHAPLADAAGAILTAGKRGRLPRTRPRGAGGGLWARGQRGRPPT